MPSPGVYNISAYQRATIQETFNLLDEDGVAFDLTGYEVRASAVGATGWIVGGEYDLEPAISDPATDGQITISKTDTDGDLEVAAGTPPFWDLVIEHTATGIILPPVLQGQFNIKKVYTPNP